MKFFKLILGVCLLSAIRVESGGFEAMNTSEISANQRASQELLAYMSIKTMFPDEKLRALAKAAGEGNSKEVDKLVHRGVDINGRGTSNATALFWAMHNIKGFEQLLLLGADPNVVFDDGSTVIHWAVRKEENEFLSLLFKHGGNPNLPAGQMGETPLFVAMGPDAKQKIKILLDAGANVNTQRNNGDTPAIVAASLGQFDVVYTLLNHGADPNIKNKNGRALRDVIEFRRKTMDPGNELSRWMEKVIDWLNNH